MNKLRWFLFTLLLCGGLLVLLWPLLARWIDRQHGVVPVDLYGRTVDEQGDPVMDVRVVAEVRKPVWTTTWTMTPRFNTIRLETTSDVQGNFSFHSEGIDLHIVEMRSGELVGHGESSFQYPFSKYDYPPGFNTRPNDPENPVTYVMRPQ